MEVDSVFSIANPYAIYYINQNFVFDESVFTKHEKKILKTSKEKAENPKSVNRYNKFKKYQEELFYSDLNELKGKYIIPMTAMSISDRLNCQKEIICPFSNQNIITNQILELMEEVPLEFLNQFVFWPLSPIDFMFCFGEKNQHKGIIHPLEEIVNKVNAETRGIGFGTIFKNNHNPKQGNFNIYAGILEPKFKINRYKRHPQSFHEKLKKRGIKNFEEYKKECNAEASFSKKILAQKYIVLFDKLNLLKTMFDFNLPNLIYFGEKTSYGKKILELMQKYSKNKYLFQFMGKSPLEGIKEITMQGIAHNTPMHRLFGFIKNLYTAKTKKRLKKPKKKFLPEWQERAKENPIHYRPCPKYSFFLCELEKCQSPCAKDIIQNHTTKKEREYIIKFADYKRVGFARIEPRLVQLMNQEMRIYVNDRKKSKLNSSWQNYELINKTFEFLDLEKFTSKEDITGDLRGSEFTMSCDIARLIAKVDRKIKHRIISEELERNPEIKKEFFRTNDPETYAGLAAIRGTAVHNIIAMPMENLTHYKTLEKAGIQPTSSNKYTELAFCHKHLVKETGETINISFHPDVQFALKRGFERDLVIIDHKTNRRLPYPYIKYIYQGKVYSYCLEKVTGIPFKNKYLIFNHMAFDNMFGLTFDPPKGYPGSEGLYRQQSFIPPTVYYPEHNFNKQIEKEIDRTYLMQKKIKQNSLEFLDQKEKQCELCFQDTEMVCNYFLRNAKQNLTFEETLEKIIA